MLNELKLASPLIWTWCEFATSSYYLWDRTYALTYRQMAGKVNLRKETAEKFVKQAGLTTIKVQINQRFTGIVCPLTTVAAYWKYVDLAGMGNSDIARAGWMAIEDFLAHQQSSYEAATSCKIIKTRYDLCILPDRPKLQILLPSNSESEEYRIGTDSAFMLIGISPKWLTKMQPRTRAELIKKGFTGTSNGHYVIVEPEYGFRLVNTINLKDCLAIWEYFAKRKSSSAIACLKALVLEPLQQRIFKQKPTNFFVSH
ncbi:hypothetical protein ACE1CI_33145 [Aerosakkonemataceae cyanobacterium BLCC-F50]|uniref:LAGLIDADG homing endonuclease n=1 Tax=Floridaenema flaviceps BLCC-F50 TaxID=3153642 RepID=A0ABV4Y1C0_9CYAN